MPLQEKTCLQDLNKETLKLAFAVTEASELSDSERKVSYYLDSRKKKKKKNFLLMGHRIDNMHLQACFCKVWVKTLFLVNLLTCIIFYFLSLIQVSSFYFEIYAVAIPI